MPNPGKKYKRQKRKFKKKSKEKKPVSPPPKKKPKRFDFRDRICDDYSCCQAPLKNGRLCSRKAMTIKTYFEKYQCCLLCWQHAKVYGIYGILSLANEMW